MPCQAVLIEQRNWSELQRNMERQRTARLARDAEVKVKEVQRALDGGSAKDFWDLVDTSAGAEECHPWTGVLNSSWTTYPVGKFNLEGCETTLAHRVACFLTFGREVPKDMDVAPLCENHLCCNIKHMMILPSSKQGGPRHARAVMAEEYFTCRSATE